uniref:Uncharacterized protein n=1 Tax=Ditylenchus dipsaci TaxID=166011 RepID=A0A915D6A8_9BILA
MEKDSMWSNKQIHKAVQPVDVVDNGVQVLIDASKDADAATPFPNISMTSSKTSVTSSTSSRSSSLNEWSGWCA